MEILRRTAAINKWSNRTNQVSVEQVSHIYSIFWASTLHKMGGGGEMYESLVQLENENMHNDTFDQ